MKPSLALCATLLLVVLGLTACENATQGPSAWLDRPLDGEKVALEPLTIQAHASDADGVARFEFRVDNDVLATVPGSGVRFADAKAGWSPPAYGTYAVKARAIDGKGNVGSDAIAYITVGERPAPSPTPSPAPSPTPSFTLSPTPSPAPLVVPSPTPSPTPSPAPTLTSSPTPSPAPAGPPAGTSPAQIAFTADRYRLKQGECTLLRWTVQGGFGVELDGQRVPHLGRAQVCPPQTTAYRLGADEGERFKWTTVTIIVEAAAPPPQPPTPTPTPAPALRLPTPTPTPAPQLPPLQSADVRFWADSENVAAGSCTTLRWHVAQVRAYWVDGEAGAGDDGSRQACPCGNETHTLHVVKGDGSEQDFHVTLHVQGECQAPPPPPPPAQDNKGPKISDVELKPRGSSDTGCRTVARAKVSDSSGVAWVRLHYNLNGDGWNTFDMGDRGGGSYEMPIPGSTGSGTIDFYVEASDSRGNTSQSGQSHQSLPPCGPG